jgi:hypothetical protein
MGYKGLTRNFIKYGNIPVGEEFLPGTHVPLSLEAGQRWQLDQAPFLIGFNI